MNLKNKITDLQEIRHEHFSTKTEKQVLDTRWNFTRTVAIRRVLVVIAIALLVIVNQAFWHLTDSRDSLRGIGFAAIILELIVFVLLRLSVRDIPETPSEFIDEREMHQKEQAYFYAYKIIEIILALLFIAFFLNFVTTNGSWINGVDWTSDKFVAVTGVAIGAISVLPTALMAWRSKDL